MEAAPSQPTVSELTGADRVLADGARVPAHGADVAVDAVGVEPTWRSAIAAVRSGGSVCVVGLGQPEGGVPVADLVRRGVTMRGHYAYTRDDFEAALQLLDERPPPLDWLSVVRLEEAAEGFRRLVEEPDGVTKVLVSIGGSK